MKKPVIALVTDFGTEDGYAGAMKGRILSEAPEAVVIDITHQIQPYNVRQAAFCLNTSYPYFRDKTVFIAVVDPGVGTERKGIMVKTSKHYFVGPDNGVFSFIFYREGFQAFEILLSEMPENVSPTFHGRDVFARIAAWLVNGRELSEILKPLKDVYSFLRQPTKISDHEYRLEVLHIDHFGNLILNFHQEDWMKIDYPESIGVQIGNIELNGIVETFGQVPEGGLLLNWDSSGFLQLAQNTGNAANTLKAGVGDELRLLL